MKLIATLFAGLFTLFMGNASFSQSISRADSDADGVQDEVDNCYLYNPAQADCNGNGIGDICDIAEGVADDCNENNVPDSCEFSMPTEVAQIIASDGQMYDFFGTSVSISADGTRVIVGALADENGTDSGSAYIYSLVNSKWIEDAKLLASDGATGDMFGRSVSISSDGTWVAIGAAFTNDAGNDSGSAYIFSLVENTWVENTKLVASDAMAGDYFGWSVSISGDGSKAIIGGYKGDGNAVDSGSAYIFSRTGSGWIEETKLSASDGISNASFGRSVSMSDDGARVVVGAYRDDYFGLGSGAAYIYSLQGSMWVEESKLLASDGGSFDYYGYSVSMADDGSRVVVGAYQADANVSDCGAAYIYANTSGNWVEETKVTPSDGESGDAFGHSVSIASNGTSVLVGASNNSLGYAYLFRFDGTSWGGGFRFATDLERYDFAYSVSHKSDTAIIGSTGSFYSMGAAHIYNLATQGALDECQCGSDINGDGVVDVSDVLAIIAFFGTNEPSADLDNDGIVNIGDLLIVVGNWGPCS